jgi:subtilase family serine protease
MSAAKKLVAVVSATAVIACMTTVTAGGPADATPEPAETALAGSTVPFTSLLPATGPVPGSEQLTIQLWLAPDVTAAASFSTAVSTPGDPLFQHYLSPAAYTSRFGASPAAAHQVERWLRAEGFTAIGTDSQRSYVRATATVATIDSALGTQLETYGASASVNAGPYPLRANDRGLLLPSSLSGSVLGVTGLDNAAPTLQMSNPSTGPTRLTEAATGTVTPCSNYYGQYTVGDLPTQNGTTSFPTIVCGYTGHQMREAYGASAADTGKGQTIALVEEGLTRGMFLTLQDYAKVNGVPAPSAHRYEQLSLGKDSCGDPFDGEEQLDVEISYDMAPGATQLVVGGDSCDNGDFGNQALYDADIAVIDGDGGHPLATVASNSWESGTESQPASQTAIEHSYLVRAVAEGVGMYFSAGDGSGVLEPSIDPDAIAVGGTTLGIGKAGNRLFETGWSDGASDIKSGQWVLTGEDGASGGGPSVHWPQPAYQMGVVPSSLGTTRSAPDISASADPFTGMALGQLSFPGGGASPTYTQIPIGGTSESSPLVAGMVIAAQQGQSSAFGFINPAIYKLADSNAFFPTLPITSSSPALDRGLVCNLAEFAHICGKPTTMTLATFDDQDPQMRGYTGQVTLPGYDNMTGLGTPDGPNFIADLRKLEG